MSLRRRRASQTEWSNGSHDSLGSHLKSNPLEQLADQLERREVTGSRHRDGLVQVLLRLGPEEFLARLDLPRGLQEIAPPIRFCRWYLAMLLGMRQPGFQPACQF